MMNIAPALSVRDLRVVRGGRTVIDGVSFDVARGSVTGLLGPSGCGKSTLMRSVVGVQVVGRRRRRGARPAGRVAAAAAVGGLRDAGAVGLRRPHASARTCATSPPCSARPRATSTGCSVTSGSTDHADALCSRLSGGQEARVSLAAALLGDPEVLVLDEPTVGLDPVLRRDLWDMFARLAAGGATLLVSSHVMDEASRCERLLLMREGRLLADDPPRALLERTGSADIEQAFLRLVDEAEAEGEAVQASDARTEGGPA